MDNEKLFFTINHPLFAILPHEWGNMTFVVGQVDDTPPKPKFVNDRYSSHTLRVVLCVIVSDHEQNMIYYKWLPLSTTI